MLTLGISAASCDAEIQPKKLEFNSGKADFDVNQIDQATLLMSSSNQKILAGGMLSKDSQELAHHAALAQVDLEKDAVDFAKTLGADSSVTAVSYESTQGLAQQARIIMLLTTDSETAQANS